MSEYIFDAKCFALLKAVAANADDARAFAEKAIGDCRFTVKVDTIGVVEVALALDDDRPDLIEVDGEPHLAE